MNTTKETTAMADQRLYRIVRGRIEKGSLVVAAEQPPSKYHKEPYRPTEISKVGTKARVQLVSPAGHEPSGEPFEIWTEYLEPEWPTMTEQKLGRLLEESMETELAKVAATLRRAAEEVEREANQLKRGANAFDVVERVQSEVMQRFNSTQLYYLVRRASEVESVRREHEARLSDPWTPTADAMAPAGHSFTDKYGSGSGSTCGICEGPREGHAENLFQRPNRRGY